MLINGTEDLRVQKTIEAIKKSFEDLICEMDYDKITVKALCDRAKINKKTFYRYYSSLDDLTAELQSIMSQDYLKRIAHYQIPEDLDKINREFFFHSERHGKVYEKITCNANYNKIRNKMIDQVMASTWKQASKIQQFDQAHQNILFRFIQSASVDIYCQWVADGKQISLEEIIELSNRLLCSGVEKFMLSQS